MESDNTNMVTTLRFNLEVVAKALHELGEDLDELHVLGSVVKNVLVLIDKGYDIDEDLSSLMHEYVNLDDVPEKINILEDEDG